MSLTNGVEWIEERAFEMCGKLKTIVLPDTIKKLSLDMFYECRGLESIEFKVCGGDVPYVYIPPLPQGIRFTKTIKDGNVNWQAYDEVFSKYGSKI